MGIFITPAVLPSINYAIFLLVQTHTSQELRVYVFCCDSACCDTKRKRVVADVVQLQVLHNGTATHI